MNRSLRWIAAAALGCVSTSALAADPEPKISYQLVEQKLALVERVLSDSPAVKRIEASDNAEARRHLSGARENYALAVLSIKNREFDRAERHLNESTALIGRARRLVPDPAARDVQQHLRYGQALESVEALRSSYQRHLQSGQPQVGAAGDARLAQVAQLVENAKALARSGQLPLANKALAEAEQALMTGLSRALHASTLNYAQRFATPADEYLHELERNRSYADLIPIAIADFKPRNEARRQVQSHLKSNRQLLERAQRHAAESNHPAALAALRRGTAHLQGALAAAGLRVPAEAQAK